MPLFNKKKREGSDGGEVKKEDALPPDDSGGRKELVFHCQQAQGSPLGLISGFSNIKELYAKIAECYDFPPEDIIFCTLNTHKVDMTKLLGGQIGLDDFIFAHRKGKKKMVELVKMEASLGLTIADNGAGYCFIKRIKEGSVIHRSPTIEVGDLIEEVGEDSMVGKRHFEVAKILKNLALKTHFSMTLVEPLKAGFANIEPRSAVKKSGKKPQVGTGRETLRLKSNGEAKIEQLPDSQMEQGINGINVLLENFYGINDSELAMRIWEKAEGKGNSMEFADSIDESDLAEFQFDDDMIIEMWGCITDARAGRIPPT